MTPEQRIARVKAVLAIAGDRPPPEACAACRHARDIDWQRISKCKSPMSRLIRAADPVEGLGEWPTLVKMRGESGLCGPEGLFFARRRWWHVLPGQRPTDGQKLWFSVFWGLTLLVLFVVTYVMALG